MRIYEVADYQEMSRCAANLISAQIILNPRSVLGLATGSTPVGIYSQLIEWYRKGDLSFAEVQTVNLDEYQGLPPDHPQSYRNFMQQNLFDHIDILPQQTHVPNGLAKDAAKECARYEALIASLGGIDLQLLGLGHNGHIGFNEPAAAFAKETHLVELTESTIEANTRFFESREAVPRQAFTMGIKTILGAKKILLAVSGKEKAEAVYRSFAGPVEPGVPCSILQFHPDVTLVGDAPALSQLKAAGVRIYRK